MAERATWFVVLVLAGGPGCILHWSGLVSPRCGEFAATASWLREPTSELGPVMNTAAGDLYTTILLMVEARGVFVPGSDGVRWWIWPAVVAEGSAPCFQLAASSRPIDDTAMGLRRP